MSALLIENYPKIFETLSSNNYEKIFIITGKNSFYKSGANKYFEFLQKDKKKSTTIYFKKKKIPEISELKNIKKMVEKLKKLEKQQKDKRKEFKEFKKSKQPDLTVNEIHNMWSKFRRSKWQLYRRIRRQKALIGFQQNVVNIIIPVKQDV